MQAREVLQEESNVQPVVSDRHSQANSLDNFANIIAEMPRHCVW